MTILAPCLAVLVALTTQIEPVSAAAPGPESAAQRIQESVLPTHYLQGHLSPVSIPRAMLERDIPGLGMAFVDNGEIVWQLSFGYADLATATPVTPETVFAAASLSKPVAAMTALNLVDRGLLGLDEDINAYLRGWQIPESEFTADERVTLRQLIGHTAGVRNYLSSSYDPGAQTPTVEEMLSGSDPSIDPPIEIEAVPGERYRYSNPGYTIIRKAIQDATGEDYGSVVDRVVFGPAGMTYSSLAQPLPQHLEAQAATGYSSDLTPAPDLLYPFLAAGGLRSTPGDLARFLGTLMADNADGGGRILTQARAAEVFAHAEQRLGFTNTPGPEDDQVLFEHWGSVAGFTSYMVGHLPENQALVVMANSDNGFNLMSMIAHAVAREYGWGQMEPTVYDEVAMPAERLPRFTGAFGSDPQSEPAFVFSIEDGALVVREPEDEDARLLVPVAEEMFISPSDNTSYQFIAASEGEIRWVRMTRASGYNSDFPKH